MTINRARALILKDNKILLIQRLKNRMEYYVLPGGKIEEGESPETTVMREVFEETSLKIKLIKKLDAMVDKDQTIHHIYLCEYIYGEPKLAHDSPEVVEASIGNVYTPMWVSVDGVTKLQMWPEGIKQFILDFLKFK